MFPKNPPQRTRPILVLLILIIFVLLCTPKHVNAEETKAQPLRVVLLLEHTKTSPWTTLAREGLARAVHDFGIEASVLVEEDPDKQEAALRAATKKADLILLVSDRFHEILRDTARSFPNTRFGCIDASIRGANITCITYADEQASFLAGAAAALFAKNARPKEPSIGWISGDDIPALQSMFHGYREGAKLAVPHVRVLHGIVGSFTNAARGAREADRLIAEGVQVIALAAGYSNEGILAKAKEAGIYVIGLDSDQKDIYPGHVLTSIVKDVSGSVYRIIKDTVLGRFKSKEIEVLDLKGGVDATNPVLSLGRKNQVLNAISQRMKELRHELREGGIRLKSFRRKTLCNCLD